MQLTPPAPRGIFFVFGTCFFGFRYLDFICGYCFLNRVLLDLFVFQILSFGSRSLDLISGYVFLLCVVLCFLLIFNFGSKYLHHVFGSGVCFEDLVVCWNYFCCILIFGYIYLDHIFGLCFLK